MHEFPLFMTNHTGRDGGPRLSTTPSCHFSMGFDIDATMRSDLTCASFTGVKYTF